MQDGLKDLKDTQKQIHSAIGKSKATQVGNIAKSLGIEMNDEEIIVFRTFDSQLLGSEKPYWTPHSAFADPDVPQGNPARSSIELRATCIFV